MKAINISEVKEHDIIRFEIEEECCGTLSGLYVGTVINSSNNGKIVIHNKLKQARHSENMSAGDPTFFEVDWLLGELSEVELLFRSEFQPYA